MKIRKAILLLLILVLASGCLGTSGTAESVPDPERELLRLHQINIGSADAYLLTVGDLVILVDCGTNITVPISDNAGNPLLFGYLEAKSRNWRKHCTGQRTPLSTVRPRRS